MRQTAHFFLSEPERNTLLSEEIWPSPQDPLHKGLSQRAAMDAILQSYQPEYALNFRYSLETALEYALLPHLGQVQVHCETEGDTVQVRVTRPSSVAHTLIPASRWSLLIDPSSLLLFFQDSYRQRDFSSLYLSSVIGCNEKNAFLFIGGDRLLGSGPLASQPITLPYQNLAFLDNPDSMPQSFLVTVFSDSSSNYQQTASRSHAVFLRDLAHHSGLSPLSSVINSASAMIILDKDTFDKKSWVNSCSWIQRNANLRSLHFLPPLPKGLSTRAKVRYSFSLLARLKISESSIYLPSSSDPTIRVYVKSEFERRKAIGPWSATLRLISRYSGLPILVYPDSMRPWL